MTDTSNRAAAMAVGPDKKPRAPFKRWRRSDAKAPWTDLGDVYPAPLRDDPNWNQRAGFSALNGGK